MLENGAILANQGSRLLSNTVFRGTYRLGDEIQRAPIPPFSGYYIMHRTVIGALWPAYHQTLLL
jgi:hypothetical protein